MAEREPSDNASDSPMTPQQRERLQLFLAFLQMQEQGVEPQGSMSFGGTPTPKDTIIAIIMSEHFPSSLEEVEPTDPRWDMLRGEFELTDQQLSLVQGFHRREHEDFLSQGNLGAISGLDRENTIPLVPYDHLQSGPTVPNVQLKSK